MVILGPTRYIFQSLFAGASQYVVKVIPLSNWVGREGYHLPARLDSLLLGVVDCLGTVRRHLHRPNFKRTHSARTRNFCDFFPRAPLFRVV